MRYSFILLFLAISINSNCQVLNLPNAYAHNDYWHPRPLFDALENGFRSVEADIFLLNGDLIVAHINPFFKADRTLEKLYFAPLAKLAAEKKVRPDNSVTLMIDIKTSGDRTYAALLPLIRKYRQLFTVYREGKVIQGSVTLVISGNKPIEMISRQKERMVFIDQDLAQINRRACSCSLYPVASCNYNKLLTWNGEGSMPQAERSLLRSYVLRAHAQGMKVRLWASPEKESVWKMLLDCDVDLINTDKLADLKDFLLKQQRPLLARTAGNTTVNYAK